MGLSPPSEALNLGWNPPEEPPRARALAHCPDRPQEAQWLGPLSLDAARFPKVLEVWLPPIEPHFPFPGSLVHVNGHFLLGPGSINTSEIPFVLTS